MQLIRKLLSSCGNRVRSGRNRAIRGLSTAELVGIIVIVGILGALGGTYVSGLVTTANTNAGKQNANTLNSTFASAVAGGALIGSPGCSASGSADTIDTTSATTAIADLNFGVVVGGVTYKMTPQVTVTPVGSSTNYLMSGAGSNVLFTFNNVAGSTP
jgi:Tfp pilus assembly protein FimT